jgi:hypothetical protein
MAAGIVAVALALALMGCGSSSSSSKVSASSYVKSVCSAATTWYRSIQTAGGHLQTTVHSSGSVAKVKVAYVAFVDALLHATQRTEEQLKSAGTPSVSRGKEISAQVVNAFEDARIGLTRAAGAVRKAPTSSTTAFETAAGSVQGTIQRALQSMASLSPQKSPELHAAALKTPACQRLRALG